MDAQEVIYGSRATHIRELQTEVSKLRAENAELRERVESLNAHFDKALLAAMELRDGGDLEIWDGWNLILGSPRAARDRAELIAQAKKTGRRIWIVLDGKDENVTETDGVRVSYTGGTGEHRADKFICDFLRMTKYLGLADRVTVRTNDKDFRKKVEKLKG